ncbi:phage gp36-like protein [Duganella sp. SG902]|uniref:gp436 family protein n=1 Tax=Duganella sp. SG902 TaxID=2587016 RepID=UPI00159D0EF7|nr:DUF1320 domain-containing protein [Duganella sp. SG902]NVM78901.1 phage gp36-like protein [Duganella sp. SG902]
MFATQDDMVRRFGMREVIQITDREMTGAIDPQVLQGGLADADAEISGYLASRYTLPLAATPLLLVGYACDIARYRLTGTDAVCTPDIESRYNQAIKYLGQVASGSISLGTDANGVPVDAGETTNATIKARAGRRRFDGRSLEGY